ncbi:uncharacterized protein PHACADRAFT_201131 [Phanerochaete carnosa HHB-10118-sp]|uniref:DUF6533 domain-containing protein n=1 Tax=Phanerochaete carnosa (strain HHB-10118-sp) TaxID=650164 RepID=K5WJA3_PHACS|nr:uncharacterized protein PHACADRAFT_201131 [Phanerochaete carnosa HHB-10118-sp]EKM50292.1 hypothetical protein PHACADRAFT_201131 [Phanerochaete carnosa HHB-10118-sp]
MSAQSGQALIQAYLRLAMSSYVDAAAACLAAYEFLITFGDEIEIVWKRPITARAVLLGSVRWCMLLAAVVNIAPTTASVSLEYLGVSDFLYTTRGSLILADAIVLILTWIKTFRHWRNARRLKMKASLTTCLLRDGTMYFIALLALNIAQLLTFNFSDTDITIINALITTLPLMLISRFIINLRTAGSTVSDYSMHMSDQQQGQSSLQFKRSVGRLGDIGGTLQDGWGDEPCDEESGVAEVGEEGRHETSAEA